ncbi:hypothetical protein BV25DRAFT_1897659 [Artomyces pyxidatus]|uniref:Uncharacterized protein n=1 Tax=Artomyces pyxidatus TaxID=48021 RepID=A0ACB8TCW7_9AGAM|nr:hypothetical protein BV25DRAFT_1897659 [Artomyces pyxidatus]
MSARSIPSSSLHRAPPVSARRHSQVFVEIPPSPYRDASKFSSRDATEDLSRPNPPPSTPLRVRNEDNMPNPPVASPQLKRKRSEHDLVQSLVSTKDATSKKQKLTADGKAKPSNTAKANGSSNANEEFPNGFFYCHQCTKKRGLEVGLPCTFKNSTGSPDAQCKAKYCKACLRNRYGQDMEEIKQRGTAVKPKESSRHVKGKGYFFKCPRCDGKCNCRACRKAQGLQPTGNLTIAAKRTGADSVAEMLGNDENLTGILPGKGKQIADAPKKVKVPKASVGSGAKQSKASRPSVPSGSALAESQPKPKRAYVRKPKPLPIVRWRRVPVPPSFTPQLAYPRIAIREFFVRFAPKEISRTHLDELEEIGGRRSFDDDELDAEVPGEVEVEMGWVSETCVKAMLMALLGLIAEGDVTGAGKDGNKAVADALKEIKASGANLSRIWSALASMRGALATLRASLTYPDPLPPPQSATVHTTRSGALHSDGLQVSSSAQLVPILSVLIDAVLSTSAVRQEIDDGLKEEKERIKEEKDRVKQERERWEGLKKEGNATKADRASHKLALAAPAQALRLVHYAYLPRFTPLGIDNDGRQYFALSPSMVEREAAFALLAGDWKKGGKAKGRAVVSEDERRGMRRWGWFVAVWGTKPELEKEEEKGKRALKGKTSESEDEEEEEGVDRWWGFWKPEDVRILAQWIARKNGISTGKDKRDGEDALMLAPEDRRASGASAMKSSHSLSSASSAAADQDANASSRTSSPLSDEDEVSSLSSMSDDESDDGDADGDVSMRDLTRTDAHGKRLPCRRELKDLVRQLEEYAEVLDWRVWRMQEDDVQTDGKGKEKEKSKGVSASSFYG